MPLPTNKNELLDSLQAAYSKLVEEAAGGPLELERNPELEGGISPCDLIAYQIGWGHLLLSWDDLETRGEAVEMPAPGFRWNQLGLLASSFYREQQEQSLQQLLAQFEALVGKIRLFIESNSEDTLFGIGKCHWAEEKWPLAKWIQVNTIAPYGSARARLCKWKQSNPSLHRPPRTATQNGKNEIDATTMEC
ncbi:MAG: ClbS/DfsB family four-helix bundle protein [Chlorobiaceae bacterium]|nr:ClbS/DfsB family four-helix bundle protein [Chlorobiaceae bacterium]